MSHNELFELVRQLKAIELLLNEEKNRREGGFVDAIDKDTHARNKLAYVIKHLVKDLPA